MKHEEVEVDTFFIRDALAEYRENDDEYGNWDNADAADAEFDHLLSIVAAADELAAADLYYNNAEDSHTADPMNERKKTKFIEAVHRREIARRAYAKARLKR